MTPETTCTLKYLAEAFGITERHGRRLAEAGIIRKIARGQCNLLESIQGYVAGLKEQAKFKATPELLVERIRIARATADKKELELAIMKKQYFFIPTMSRILSNLIIETKSAILASSAKVAPLIHAGVQSPAEIKALIDDKLHEALSSLARMSIEKLLPGREGPAKKATRKGKRGKRTGKK